MCPVPLCHIHRNSGFPLAMLNSIRKFNCSIWGFTHQHFACSFVSLVSGEGAAWPGSEVGSNKRFSANKSMPSAFCRLPHKYIWNNAKCCLLFGARPGSAFVMCKRIAKLASCQTAICQTTERPAVHLPPSTTGVGAWSLVPPTTH